jgi:hypothetical protein
VKVKTLIAELMMQDQEAEVVYLPATLEYELVDDVSVATSRDITAQDVEKFGRNIVVLA